MFQVFLQETVFQKSEILYWPEVAQVYVYETFQIYDSNKYTGLLDLNFS